jgi:hypothetical protein
MKEFVGHARIVASVVGFVAATLFAAGCSTSKSSTVTSAELTGIWQLTMPDRSQQMVRIMSEGGQRFRIWKGNSLVNGVYERRGNQLVMLTPADPRLTEFVWRIDDAQHLTLIKEPPVSKTGRRCRTATLLKTG